MHKNFINPAIYTLLNHLSVVVLLCLILSSCSNSNNKAQPLAVKGIIDLASWDFDKDGATKFDGDWEFYWEQLLTPEDFFNDSPPSVDGYLNIPDYWIGQNIDGNVLDGEGYCTVRLIIRGDYNEKKLMLHVKEIMSACNVFFDGENVGSYGKVGRTCEEMIADYHQLHIPIKMNGKQHELIIQASNFHHRLGGFFDSISVGEFNSAQRSYVLKICVDIFLFSSLLIMALYHFGLFVFRKAEKAPLFFGLFSFIIGLRMLLTSEQSLTFFLPGLNWDMVYRMEYISLFIATPLFIAFFRSIFPKELPKWFMFLVVVISALYTIFALSTKTVTSSKVVTYYHLLVLSGVAFSFIGLILAIIRKREGALLLLLGIMCVLVTAVNDILYNQSIIHSVELTGAGMFIFILFQSFVISSRFTKTFNENETLNVELEYQKTNLEEIVVIRTAQISQQKEEILSQRDELYDKNDTLLTKNKLIMDSIAYAKLIQYAILPSQELISKYLPDSFVFFKPRDIVSGDFYWFTEKDNNLYLAVVDCTGHGVPGAFMSMIGNTILNQIVIKDNIVDPSDILSRLNDEVIFAFDKGEEDSLQDDGMELTLSKIDLITKEISIAAANQIVYYCSPDIDDIQIIRGNSYSIGGKFAPETKHTFLTHKIDYKPGTSVYMFSDGFADQFGGPESRKFYSAGIKKMLGEIRHLNMVEQSALVEKTFENWKADQRQTDDVLMVGFRLG